MIMISRIASIGGFFLALSAAFLVAQEPPSPGKSKAEAKAKATTKSKAKAKGKGVAAVPAPAFLAPVAERFSSVDAVKHRDFPDTGIDVTGGIWTVYIEHDGIATSPIPAST